MQSDPKQLVTWASMDEPVDWHRRAEFIDLRAEVERLQEENQNLRAILETAKRRDGEDD